LLSLKRLERRAHSWYFVDGILKAVITTSNGGDSLVAKEITFPEQLPLWLFEQDCLVFPALVDGKPVECMVTGEFLMTHFAARDMTEESMQRAYRDHKPEIQDIATNHIENGWIDEEGRIFLSMRFTRLKVVFGAGFDKWPEGRAAVDAVDPFLRELIGPTAEAISVEWNAYTDTPGPPVLRLRITDPATPYAAERLIGGKERQDPISLRLILAEVWGTVLRARSRKLLRKMG
jgi:hypothetical protein